MRTILSALTLSFALALGSPVAQADSYAPALFGAILGGVAGHQLAHGHNPRAATIAGAVVGAGLAHAIASSQVHSAPTYRPSRSHRPVHYWQGYDERYPSYEAPEEEDYYYEEGVTSWDWDD